MRVSTEKDEVRLQIFNTLQTIGELRNQLVTLNRQYDDAKQQLSDLDSQIKYKQDSATAILSRLHGKHASVEDAEKLETQRQRLDAEHQKHKLTIDTQQEFFLKQINEIDREIMKLTMQLGKIGDQFITHWVLILDHSGSMMGSKWDELMKAVDAFVDYRKDQKADLLSIIIFDSKAYEHIRKGKFSNYTRPEYSHWGGTNFDAAFDLAQDFIEPNHRTIAVFLTDGEPTHNQRTDYILQKISSNNRDRGFKLFAIGAGDFNYDYLKKITRIANDGKDYMEVGNDKVELLHSTKDEKVLVKIFSKIVEFVQSFDAHTLQVIEQLEQRRNRSSQKMNDDMNQLYRLYEDRVKESFKIVKGDQEQYNEINNQEVMHLNRRQSELRNEITLLLEEKQRINSVAVLGDINATEAKIAYYEEILNNLKAKEVLLHQDLQNAAETLQKENHVHINTLIQIKSLQNVSDINIKENMEYVFLIISTFFNKINSVDKLIKYFNSTHKESSTRQDHEITRELTKIYKSKGLMFGTTRDGPESIELIAMHVLKISDDDIRSLKLVRHVLDMGLSEIIKVGRKQEASIEKQILRSVELDYNSSSEAQQIANLSERRRQLLMEIEEKSKVRDAGSPATRLVNSIVNALSGSEDDQERRLCAKQSEVETLDKTIKLMSDEQREAFKFYKILRNEWNYALAKYEDETKEAVFNDLISEFYNGSITEPTASY